MTREIAIVAIACLLLLVVLLVPRAKITVTVSPEIEAAAQRIVKELP